VSDFALTVVSAVALVLTFVVSTSMLIVMMGESRRLPWSALRNEGGRQLDYPRLHRTVRA
jgi:hypothetical protein